MKTNQDDSNMIEFEIRMDQKLIKKNQFDAIFKFLHQRGFTIESTEYQLRIQPKVSDIPSNYRIELNTLLDIQEYCQNDILPALIIFKIWIMFKLIRGLLNSAVPIKALLPKIEPIYPRGLICSLPRMICPAK